MKKRRRFTPEFKSKVVLDVLTGAQSPGEVMMTGSCSSCRRRGGAGFVAGFTAVGIVTGEYPPETGGFRSDL